MLHVPVSALEFSIIHTREQLGPGMRVVEPGARILPLWINLVHPQTKRRLMVEDFYMMVREFPGGSNASISPWNDVDN